MRRTVLQPIWNPPAHLPLASPPTLRIPRLLNLDKLNTLEAAKNPISYSWKRRSNRIRSNPSACPVAVTTDQILKQDRLHIFSSTINSSCQEKPIYPAEIQYCNSYNELLRRSSNTESKTDNSSQSCPEINRPLRRRQVSWSERRTVLKASRSWHRQIDK